MNIGELSALLDMPASTIRYYERVGILEPAARVSGRRLFGQSAITSLRFIQLAKAAGFTVAEIRTLRDSYAADSQSTDLWRSLAKTKRVSVRHQIAGFEQMDAILSAMLTCECATLNQCVERCFANPSSAKV